MVRRGARRTGRRAVPSRCRPVGRSPTRPTSPSRPTTWATPCVAREIALSNGGLLFDESVVLGDPAEGRATLKVPPDRLSSTLDELGTLGEVTSRSQHADDVTTQVVDLDARIETARTSVERLQEFLGDAASVEDVATLEAELTQRETELEQLVAQQRALEGRVELATVTAVFSEPDDDDTIEGIPGVGSAFRAGLDAFVAVVQIGLVVVAWSLPFLALAAIVAGVVLWWRRRRRARRIDGPTGPTIPTGWPDRPDWPDSPDRLGGPTA